MRMRQEICGNRSHLAAVGNCGGQSTGEAGSVLMEYVVLCCSIGLGVAAFTYTQFYNVNDGYVGIGEKFVEWRQVLLHALSLPIP